MCSALNLYAQGTTNDGSHIDKIVDGVIAFLDLTPDLATVFPTCQDDFAEINAWHDKWSKESKWRLRLSAQNGIFMRHSETTYQCFEMGDGIINRQDFKFGGEHAGTVSKMLLSMPTDSFLQ